MPPPAPSPSTATAAVKVALDAIAKAKHLNAFTSVESPSTLLQLAAESDARHASGNPLSPLDGALIAIKDNICTTTLPTTCASAQLSTYTSPYPSTVSSLLLSAGLIPIAKTNLDEFGMGSHSRNSHFGAVANPLDSALSPGGSSGGSAAAVAAGICDLALGTDTGGSVRLPGSYTRTVGFKPSYGLLSRWGVVAYANSLDTVGLITKRWRDARTLFSILAQQDPKDPTSIRRPSPRKRPSRSLRVGVPAEYNLAELTPSARETWAATLSHLSSRGAEIIPVSLPNTKHSLAAYYILAPAEASSNLARYDGLRYGVRAEEDRIADTLFAATRKRGLGEEVRKRILVGAFSLSSAGMDNYFRQAQKVRRLVKEDFGRVLKEGEEGVDVVIAPAALGPPPMVGEVEKEGGVEGYVNDVLTVPASLAGLPSLCVPVKGSDVGMQVMAKWGGEEEVWWAAEKLEGIVDA